MSDKTFDPTHFIPIKTSIAALESITEAQRWKFQSLCRGYKAHSASLYRDDFNNTNLLFSIFKEGGAFVIGGLIEPDGSSHT